MKHSLTKAEQLLHSGNREGAANYLKGLKPSALPRELCQRVANLARQVGNHSLALRILNPIIRPTDGLPSRATAMEKCIYAAALSKIGAIGEANQLLSSVNSSEAPDALLYRSHCSMAQWDYEQPIPWLRKYVALVETGSRQQIIGQLNLAACLTMEGFSEEAETLLLSLRARCSDTDHRWLLGSVLEVLAQAAIQRKNFKLASQALEEASQIGARGVMGLEAFLVEKWVVYLELARTPADIDRHNANLHELRKNAERLSHSESIRDVDLTLGVINKCPETLTTLYFGTPFSKFHQHMFRKIDFPFEVPSRWKLKRDRGDQYALDLSKRTKLSRQSERLLKGLVSDFYREFRIGELFYALYPEEHFNPISSPKRVEQSVAYLRKQLKEHNMGLDINHGSQGYRFVLGYGTSLHLSREKGEGWWTELKCHFPSGSFKMSEACRKLNMSKATLWRKCLLKMNEGSLLKERCGPHTLYKIS